MMLNVIKRYSLEFYKKLATAVVFPCFTSFRRFCIQYIRYLLVYKHHNKVNTHHQNKVLIPCKEYSCFGTCPSFNFLICIVAPIGALSGWLYLEQNEKGVLERKEQKI